MKHDALNGSASHQSSYNVTELMHSLHAQPRNRQSEGDNQDPRRTSHAPSTFSKGRQL
jgi:hypothetical protein